MYLKHITDFFCKKPRTKSVDELEKNPNTGTPPNSRGCIRKRSRSLKYHKSQSLDEENFKVHELETTLSSPRIADEQKHENHILCKRLSIYFGEIIAMFTFWIYKYFVLYFFRSFTPKGGITTSKWKGKFNINVYSTITPCSN